MRTNVVATREKNGCEVYLHFSDRREDYLADLECTVLLHYYRRIRSFAVSNGSGVNKPNVTL